MRSQQLSLLWKQFQTFSSAVVLLWSVIPWPSEQNLWLHLADSSCHSSMDNPYWILFHRTQSSFTVFSWGFGGGVFVSPLLRYLTQLFSTDMYAWYFIITWATCLMLFSTSSSTSRGQSPARVPTLTWFKARAHSLEARGCFIAPLSSNSGGGSALCRLGGTDRQEHTCYQINTGRDIVKCHGAEWCPSLALSLQVPGTNSKCDTSLD